MKRQKKANTKFVKGILLLFFWPLYLLWLFMKLIVRIAKSLFNSSQKQQKAVIQNTVSEDAYSFEAVGVNYRLDNLMSLAEQARNYNWDDDRLLQKYGEGQTLYKYFFNRTQGALVPEPTNPHDPNAIKVELNGLHVAYVPAHLCKDVRSLLEQGYIPKVSVKGGPRKMIQNGAVCEIDRNFHVYVDMGKS